MEAVVLALRVLLAVMFLSAAWSKTRNMGMHILLVEEYRVLPKVLVRPFAFAEVAAEWLIGAMLLCGLYPKLASLAMAGLLFLYGVAIAINLIRGRREISCGCGGIAGEQALSWLLIVRNTGLIALCAAVYVGTGRWGTFSAVIAGMPATGAFDFSFWVVALSAVVGLYLMLAVAELSGMRRQIRYLLRKE